MQPQDPDYDARLRASFQRQHVMNMLGARLTRIAPGETEVEMPYRADLTQQHGFLHAGIVTTILDTACGYAAFSLMPADTGDAALLSIEFKTNLLAPARGELLVARARVVRAGRTVTVCQADGVMMDGGREVHVAIMTATMMTVATPGVAR
ncbi:MAG TPA: PaaI family thioesterase [Longimicrobium sp.]